MGSADDRTDYRHFSVVAGWDIHARVRSLGANGAAGAALSDSGLDCHWQRFEIDYDHARSPADSHVDSARIEGQRSAKERHFIEREVIGESFVTGAPKRAMRLSAVVITLTNCVMLSGCLKSTEPQPSLLALNGSWNYTGVQTSPVQETLTGTLTISRESGTSFQGELYLVGVNSQTGQNRVLSGLVSGSATETDVVDFDAHLEATARRHVGQIVADTMTGTWVGAAADGSIVSGSFRVERETR